MLIPKMYRFPPSKKLSNCCNATIIWDECEPHLDIFAEQICEATCCEECGKQLDRDCENENT